MTVLDELTAVFRQVFEDDSIVLDPKTTANDIEGWDSLSHVILILAIEDHFKIRFNQKELLVFNEVGDLLNSIIEKVENKR